MEKIKRALISVSDKTGIVPFAKQLQAMQIEIISTGGTAKMLSENGIAVIPVGYGDGFYKLENFRHFVVMTDYIFQTIFLLEL